MYARVFFGAIFASFLVSPAVALDMCSELWFTRNLIFDRAGYCFSSPLGEAMFDNRDCKTRSPALSTQESEIIAWVRTSETEWECAIDTSLQSLNVLAPRLRREIVDIPLPQYGESGCSGWLGEVEPLFDRRSGGGFVTGQIHPGDDVYFAFEGQNGWDFVVNSYGEKPTAMGWTQVFQKTGDWMRVCTGVAG